jgi:hypothetical protein
MKSNMVHLITFYETTYCPPFLGFLKFSLLLWVLQNCWKALWKKHLNSLGPAVIGKPEGPRNPCQGPARGPGVPHSPAQGPPQQQQTRTPTPANKSEISSHLIMCLSSDNFYIYCFFYFREESILFLKKKHCFDPTNNGEMFSTCFNFLYIMYFSYLIGPPPPHPCAS